ncbi:hypothetical protein PM082_009706 [Marasmius tenuissimus]|nr:hypothetical protein PM082_009706 [Marasmius tenuissimus]
MSAIDSNCAQSVLLSKCLGMFVLKRDQRRHNKSHFSRSEWMCMRCGDYQGFSCSGVGMNETIALEKLRSCSFFLEWLQVETEVELALDTFIKVLKVCEAWLWNLFRFRGFVGCQMNGIMGSSWWH